MNFQFPRAFPIVLAPKLLRKHSPCESRRLPVIDSSNSKDYLCADSMDSGSGEGNAFPMSDDYESLFSTTEIEPLKRAWRNEKAAPQILQFDDELVQRTRQLVQLMEEMVEEFTSSGKDPMTVSLYQMDLDRTLFLLRSYMRTRLQKIEKYMFHIKQTTEMWNRLSREEQKFAERCIEDMEQHLDQSILSKLPSSYKSVLKQSSSSEENDMVPEPQLGAYVICRSKRFLGSFQLDDSGEEPVNIEADDLYALPYKSIKALVETGQIDLV